MNQKDKNKSKLFIKTKSAAMGVRGTDFQVNYNPVNDNTILITFSGAVAMAQITEPWRALVRPQIKITWKAVSSDNAVVVKKGEFSGVTKNSQRATIPVKMSPVQLESLKSNESGIKQGGGPEEGGPRAGNENKGPKKQLRSIVPPGMDAKAVANDNSEVKNVVAVPLVPRPSKLLNSKSLLNKHLSPATVGGSGARWCSAQMDLSIQMLHLHQKAFLTSDGRICASSRLCC